MTNNATINNLPFGVFNAMVPSEGPKIIPVSVDLTVNQSVLIDISPQQQSGKISFVQSVFVDNSNNSQPTLVNNPVTQVTLVVPPNSQALLPIFVGNPPKLVVSIVVALLNILVSATVWGGSSQFRFSGGKLLVSDPTLENLISNIGGAGNGLGVNLISPNPLPVNVVSGGGGSQVDKYVSTTSTNQLNNFIPAPGAGHNTVLQSIFLSIAVTSVNSGGGGPIAFSIVDGAGTIYFFRDVYLPTAALAAGTNFVQDFVVFNETGLNLELPANTSLNVNLGGGGSFTAGFFFAGIGYYTT